jgi:ACS family glucarate transporter-like MFS transporter
MHAAGRSPVDEQGVLMDSGGQNISPLLKSKRFYIVVLLFFNIVINYIDRINLSVAAPLIAKQFHWDPGRMGIIFSSFLWTYAVALIPCGWLADKLGSRRVNSGAITIWSIGAMLTGAITGFGNMIAARLVLGAGEAASYPVAGKVVRQWFPASERGVATAIFNAGAYAGPAVATPLVAWIVLQAGWRPSFIILGALGFVWLIFWIKWFRVPEECTWLSPEEKDYIISHRDNQPAKASGSQQLKVSVTRLLAQKSMWGLAITQGCAVYTQYLFLTWLPSYLVQARGMRLAKAGIFAALPFFVAVVLGILIGKISDKVLDAEKMKKGNRRIAVITFMLFSSVVLVTNMIQNELAVLALISISLTSISSAITLNFALANDLISEPRVTGTVIGTQVLGGNLFGLTAPIITGFIVKATGSFNSAFILAGALLIFGALVSFTLTRKSITYDIEGPRATAAGVD